MNIRPLIQLTAFLYLPALVLISCRQNEIKSSWALSNNGDSYTLTSENYSLTLEKKGAKLSMKITQGDVTIPPSDSGSFFYRDGYAERITGHKTFRDSVQFELVNKNNEDALLTVFPGKEAVKLKLRAFSGNETGKIFISTGGISPAYGMGEHAGYPMHPFSPASTEITGYRNDSIIGSVGNHFAGRMVSNFVIFPKHNFAEVNIDPMLKIGRFTEEENTQGSWGNSIESMYYFFGDPETIYKNFLEVRNLEGYPFMKPKYELFGLGWEAWGALAWSTDQHSVERYVNEFLERGYPLKWIVIGSGFWPKGDSSMLATTSFGMWDTELYPEPAEMIDSFHKKNLKVLIGLRIAFLEKGPYTAEGLENGYFLKENGKSKIHRIGFPKGNVYLLDNDNPDAVAWYVNLCQKWTDFGVDGFKEDIYGYYNYILPDNKVNHINEQLMKKGLFIIGRNNYLGSPADIHRIEDFNYDHHQDRGPICALTFAYSGFPYVYPDVLGGEPYFSNETMRAAKFQNYITRLAWFTSLSPAMALGTGPWKFGSDTVNQIIKKAALFHDRIHPYIFHNAVKTHISGFPYTMTPMPLKYPDENMVFLREDTIVRGYQWLIGESLLATPVYGNDFEHAESREIFIPEGKWMNLESGIVFEGPQLIDSFQFPIDVVPAFVGGNGILLTKENETISAAIYPVTTSPVEEEFYLPDGESSFYVKLSVNDWSAQIMVVNSKNEPVDYNREDNTNALIFTVRNNETYTIESR